MGEYSKYIAPERRAVPTPKDMVKDGVSIFGTFDKEFETMDLMSIKNATALPKFCNKLKLTLWEATEVHLKDGVLLAVVCDMGIFGKLMNVFYDKETHNVYCWDTQIKSKDTTIAPNLINGSICEGRLGETFVKYVNNFEVGKATLDGKAVGKCLVTKPRKDKTAVQAMKENVEDASIEYSLKLDRLSLPCVVSIPFAKDRPRPLYSQKDFFKVEGSLTINGKTYTSDDFTTGIIDDHRGYYPRKAHYDWLTTMGKIKVNGKEEWIAFNLTRNQSIDQEKYNENLIWKEGRSSLLPPVTFTKDKDVKELLKGEKQIVHVKDEHGMVDLTYEIEACSPMITHAVIVKIDYYVTFGKISGFLIDEDGTKYEFENAEAIGEDKTLLL